MSAVDATRVRIACLLLYSIAIAAGCTSKKVPNASGTAPVATPTSTPEQQQNQMTGSGPDVPFDGGRPEALGTALPQIEANRAGGSVPADPKADSSKDSPSPLFDVYGMLTGSSAVCEEETR
jgi:hypothetical protein